jgi:hypothetical protein
MEAGICFSDLMSKLVRLATIQVTNLTNFLALTLSPLFGITDICIKANNENYIGGGANTVLVP